MILRFWPIRQLVAPHAGAWIETFVLSAWVVSESSPLTQGRGLKQDLRQIAFCDTQVAPHAGAWIETLIWLEPLPLLLSPLTQGRGLKLFSSLL